MVERSPRQRLARVLQCRAKDAATMRAWMKVFGEHSGCLLRKGLAFFVSSMMTVWASAPGGRRRASSMPEIIVTECV